MPRPLYRCVIDTVIARIASGALLPGAMLPSETQLGAELGVSQGTARKALGELEARGLVQRVQGRGTFVAVTTPDSSLFNFFRLRAEGGRLDSPTLDSQSIMRRAAAPEESQALVGCPDEVFEITRVRSLSGRQLIHETSSVPIDLFPGLADRGPLPNTLYVFYQQAYSCIIVRADEHLRAIAAPPDIATTLGVPAGAPVFEVRRRAIDVLDRVVELRRSHCVTDTYAYCVSLS